MPTSFRFGAVEVQPATRQLLIAGVPAVLGARAFDLLLALIERRDRLVPKRELLDAVWRDQVVEEGNLHVQVSSLRKLLGPAAITTVPGRGFRFMATLEGAADQPAADGTGPPQAPEPTARRPGNVAVQVQPLFGREAALHTLLAQIEAQRLVTVIGASGMGKTTLALAAADALRERWRDGVWFVELAALTDPTQLPHAVALTLRISLPQPCPRPQRWTIWWACWARW